MTGAQKVAVNTPDHIVGVLSHLRLKMEHQLCLEIPRLGELIAFRKVFDQIPPDVAMDEAFVEALIIRRGMQVRYAPDAVVYNMGPETVGDFVKQRRRNYAGHLYLKDKYGYQVSSLQNTRVLRLALEEVWGAIRLVGTLGVLAVAGDLLPAPGRLGLSRPEEEARRLGHGLDHQGSRPGRRTAGNHS